VEIERFLIKSYDFLFLTPFFCFDEFCRMCCFEFLNSDLTKNLEIDSSFFRIFYFNFYKIFENFKFDRPGF
jgi:hypothetical protein